jgi:hypothetical protein
VRRRHPIPAGEAIRFLWDFNHPSQLRSAVASVTEWAVAHGWTAYLARDAGAVSILAPQARFGVLRLPPGHWAVLEDGVLFRLSHDDFVRLYEPVVAP